MGYETEFDYEDENIENSKIKLTAKRRTDNKLVHASATTKHEGPFYCPDTFEDLIVRKCVEKRDHFAYHARQSPVGSKESALHKACKAEIRSLLQSKFPVGNWEEERTFKEDKIKGYKEVRADISGRIGGRGVIIEVQASTLSIKTIIERTYQYSMRGAFILWIVPLEEDLGQENFRPRLFERYLHSIYYGRIYYWNKGDGTMLRPVHFGTAARYIEASSWFEEGGHERTAGGYYKPYLRVKQPVYGPEVDLINFIGEQREAFEMENEKLSIEKCRIWRDGLAHWWRDEETIELKKSVI